VGSGLSKTAKGGAARQDTSPEVNLSKGRERDYSMGGDESIRPERAGKAEREGGREWNPSSIHPFHPSTTHTTAHELHRQRVQGALHATPRAAQDTSYRYVRLRGAATAPTERLRPGRRGP
jgi:hypothetical protein